VLAEFVVTFFVGRGILLVMSAGGFGVVYAREAEMVLLFLARRTLDASVAADLTAETFALALCSWPRLEGRAEEEVRAWLLTVARRQASRYLRRARVERRAVARLGVRVPEVHEDDLADIERRAGLDELRRVLRVELARLSPRQREALRLRVVEERPYEEVAKMLGISEATARARVSRGLRALKGWVESAQGLRYDRASVPERAGVRVPAGHR
jgi:RNA polymerase sigma factor (sigma-70 family)